MYRCPDAWVVSALVALAASACSKENAPAPRPARTSPSEIASALRVDASVLEGPVDPLPPAGDLRSDIDRFTTLDACVAERAALDPLVGDAIHAIAYESFLRDACRMLDAAKATDKARCDAIVASPLKSRCEMLVAVIAGDADSCPWEVSSKPSFGRDPTCLAVSSHDARLCGGVSLLDRPTCAALASHDASRCDEVMSGTERAICRRELARLTPILPATNDDKPLALAPASMKLVLEALGETPPLVQPEITLTDDVGHGLVLNERRDGVHFDIGSIHELSPSFYAASPLTRAYIGLTLIVSSTGNNKDVKVDRCELGMPNAPPLVAPIARCALTTTIDELSHARGGAVRVHVDGEIGSSPRGYHVHLEMTTFVRDLVTTSAAAAVLLPPHGAPDSGAPRR